VEFIGQIICFIILVVAVIGTIYFTINAVLGWITYILYLVEGIAGIALFCWLLQACGIFAFRILC